MRRAAAAPLLSLLMPGLGQLYNRQAGKGAILIMATTLVFLGTLGMFAMHFNRAMAVLAGNPERLGDGTAMEVMHRQLLSQGVSWLLAALALYLAILAFALIDAWRTGRALDQAGPAREK